MNKHVCRVLVLTLGLLVLSCSRSAAPNSVPSPSSKTPCSLTVPCADDGEVCDMLFPAVPGGTGGSCRAKCNPNGPACADDGDVCNPITGACDTTCGGQVPANSFCGSQLPNNISVRAVCVNSSYCAVADVSPGQGACATQVSGLKGSGGFCKVACTSNPDCVGPWQTCDAITKTCEVGCSTEIPSSCKSVSYTLSGSTPPLLACSEITATCVPGCTVSTAAGSSTTCTALDTTRTNCYSLGYQTTIAGTCEKPCAKSSSCGDASLTCAEGVCQSQCTSDTSPGTVNPKRSRCDYMTAAYAIGCSNNTDCASHGATMACSSLSATCVAGCTANQGCPVQDTLRAGCVQAFIGGIQQGYSSCEVACAGWQTSLHEVPLQGTCISGAKNYSCKQNANYVTGSSFAQGYCGIQCTPTSSTCNDLGNSQSCNGVCSL